MRRLLALAVFLSAPATAQSNESWKRPFQPHKIVDRLFYVGTEDLACFLIPTREGHILINSGLPDSAPLIRKSVEKLGYKFTDIKLLLTTQGHFDHTAALAEIQKQTGAKVQATNGDAPLLEDGGASDPFLGPQYRFAPVKVDRRLKNGDTISLGGVTLHVHLTPGHTPGSVSYAMTALDNGKKISVLIANMNTVVMPLVNNAKYPRIAEDYRRAFRVQKALAPDVWVASHASQYDMQRKLKAGSFVDPEGYKAAVLRYEKAFEEQLAKEGGG